MSCFLNPSHQSVCPYVYPSIVTRQWLSKNVIMATNTHATIEELLDAFSVWSNVVSKESRKLVLPRISCLEIITEWHKNVKLNGSLNLNETPLHCV
jgi:hypothetical protein